MTSDKNDEGNAVVSLSSEELPSNEVAKVIVEPIEPAAEVDPIGVEAKSEPKTEGSSRPTAVVEADSTASPSADAKANEGVDTSEVPAEEERKREPRKSGKPAIGVRSPRRRAESKSKKESYSEDDEDSDEGEDDSPVETSALDISEHDPLAPAYDLEAGEPIKPIPEQLPWKSKVRSAKEFFNTEVLYRFDIIEPQYLEPIKGTFRVELKGAQGGVWSFTVGDQLEVVNSREEAETVLSMSQQDFIDIVNGTLNPQLAILSQKVKIVGDAKKAILVQELLAPAVE